eukprot:s1673_g6.t1
MLQQVCPKADPNLIHRFDFPDSRRLKFELLGSWHPKLQHLRCRKRIADLADFPSLASTHSADRLGLSGMNLDAATEQLGDDTQEEKAPKSEKSGPNFSGEWVLLKVEGDFDAFMKAKGIGYVSRSLAKSMGYGVNKVHQSVEHDGDKLKITTTNPKGTKVMNLLANGEEQDGTDPIDDKPIKIRAAWDGPALVMTLRSQRPAKELGSVRRYLQEEAGPQWAWHIWRTWRVWSMFPDAVEWKAQLEAMKAARRAEELAQQQREAEQDALVKSWQLEVQEMKVERNAAVQKAEEAEEHARRQVQDYHWATAKQLQEMEERITQLQFLLNEERSAHAVELAHQVDLVAQVRREADMQIREAEHRHRAELAAEQERVREAHEMVELIQERANKDVTAARAREEARIAKIRSEAETRTRELEKKMREEASMR